MNRDSAVDARSGNSGNVDRTSKVGTSAQVMHPGVASK
jgi:hypothetical protein